MTQSPSMSILVPLDGSELSESALPLAVHAARDLRGRLLLVTAPQISGLDVALYGDSSIPIPEMQPLVPLDLLMGRARDESADYLGLLARKLHEDQVEVETLVRDGDPAQVILDELKNRPTILVVMATHGRGGLRRWAFGSVADKVIRRSEVPVLLVRSASEKIRARPRHVLVPLDGSKASEIVLDTVAPFASGHDAKVTLAHVVPDFHRIAWAANLNAPEIVTGYRRWLEGYLMGPTERLAGAGVEVGTEILSGDNVADALLERQAKGDVDLVALSTHGRGGAARFTMGSVADRIVRSGSTPVLVARRRAESLPDSPATTG